MRLEVDMEPRLYLNSANDLSGLLTAHTVVRMPCCGTLLALSHGFQQPEALLGNFQLAFKESSGSSQKVDLSDSS